MGSGGGPAVSPGCSRAEERVQAEALLVCRAERNGSMTPIPMMLRHYCPKD